MLIIIRKKSGANDHAWDYPDKPKYFKTSFVNPDNRAELICLNGSGKSLAQLSALSSYPILEYSGSISDGDQYRTIVSAREMIELLGADVYAKIYRGATKSTTDATALFFLEYTVYRALNDQIDVSTLTAEMVYFKTQTYMNDADMVRVQRGIKIN